MKKILQILGLSFAILGICLLIFVSFREPSLHRDWSQDQKILSSISFSGNIVDIKNIRNFKYNTVDDYEEGYYDKKYDLDALESLYYVIEPFSDYDGPAHTMLSFGFRDGTYVSISVEIRKEVGEEFSAFMGLLNSYELVYILGDENDLIKLRANYRKDDVYLYPIKAQKEDIKTLFISMLRKADDLTKKPEFYNTFTNNCTTNILEHVNAIRTEDIPWNINTILPSHSDRIIYDLGLIDTSLSLEQAREYYKINDLSEKYADSQNYSQYIRKPIK